MSNHDRTFSDASEYGSRKWVAFTLGMSESTFGSKREKLEQQGFPRRDLVVGLYLKADVTAWISRRRQIADKVIDISEQKEEQEINVKSL